MKYKSIHKYIILLIIEIIFTHNTAFAIEEEPNSKLEIPLILLPIIIIGIFIGINVFIVLKRKRMERVASNVKAIEVKERLERIINTAPLMFMVTVDGIIVEMNEKVHKEIGLDLGDNIERIYVNPSIRAQYVSSVMAEGIIRDEVVEFKFIDGKVHRCLINFATADYDGQAAIVLWAVDIEASEKQKDHMKITHQSIHTILDTMPAAVRIIEREGLSVIYANKACVKMFGYQSFEEMEGHHVSDMISTINGKKVDIKEVASNVLNEGDPYVMEGEYFTASGSIIDVRITVCKIDYNGIKSILSIMQDLTSEKEYKRMLSSMAEKERESNQLKSRFLVNMSHEIRTPMNAIIGLAEIEIHKQLPREAKEIYLKISNSAKNLLDIINDILDLSKIEADKMELYEEEFELEEVVNSALLVASPRLDGKNVEFIYNASLDLPSYVIGDKTRLWQILKNFLDNSAKYTDEGKVILKISTDDEQQSDEAVTIMFVIKDTGIGISNEQIDRIFMPYEQIYNQAQKKYSGTGLGMVISKQLCELMGGTLQIESHENQGTTISLSIPFKRGKNNEIELHKVKVPILEGMKVLVVDDDNLSLKIMEELLKSNNINYITADSGYKALEIILEQNNIGESFDAIILDYMMEGLNGLETAKQMPLSLENIPKFLLVTAYQKMLMKSELERNGIYDVIEKPFMPSQFIRKLCKVKGYELDDIDNLNSYTRFNNVKVLICEDYVLNQEVAIGMLLQFGIESTIAEDGKQGIEILKGDRKFDLIFMDLQMPIMDGYEATQIIRSNPIYDNIPIISLTADAMKEVADKCLEMGMNDHIEKPIEFETLHRILCKWLPESKQITDDKAYGLKTTELSGVLARFGGKKEVYEKALTKFAQLINDEWQDFNSITKDSEEMKAYVHKLKGVAGNLSEDDIYKASINFEASLKNNAPDKTLYEQLIKACIDFKKRINK